MSQQLHWCGQVPTTASSTVPFQRTTTALGPVGLRKPGMDFRVDYFSKRDQRDELLIHCLGTKTVHSNLGTKKRRREKQTIKLLCYPN